MKISSILVIGLGAFVLSGCVQDPPEPPNSPESLEPPVVADPVTDVVAESSTPAVDASAEALLPPEAFRIDPLKSCDAGQVTTLHWTDAAVAFGHIRIWADGNPPGLFAKSASAGSKTTGAWVSPGARFWITDSADRILARREVESEIPCD